MKKITIIVADDHTVVREGTRKMLERDPELEILAEASNGRDALNLTELKRPDILLLDISMPDINGIEVLKILKSKYPDQKIVFFSAYSDLQYVKTAIKENVNGYLTKSMEFEELVSKLKRIYKGEQVVSKDISFQLSSQFVSDIKNKTDLTPREYEITVFISNGFSNQDIANELCIAVRTVETHVANILKKLNVANRTQISSYAHKHGLI
jgi:DNA-binding NarL/FixJ family response regulator